MRLSNKVATHHSESPKEELLQYLKRRLTTAVRVMSVDGPWQGDMLLYSFRVAGLSLSSLRLRGNAILVCQVVKF